MSAVTVPAGTLAEKLRRLASIKTSVLYSARTTLLAAADALDARPAITAGADAGSFASSAVVGAREQAKRECSTLAETVRLRAEQRRSERTDAAKIADDAAVDAFATAMKAKLAAARAKGRSGWNTDRCNSAYLSRLLREHVEKGDPIDVANFCMMLNQRGESIAALTPETAEAVPVAGQSGEPIGFLKPETPYAEGSRFIYAADRNEDWMMSVFTIPVYSRCAASTPKTSEAVPVAGQSGDAVREALVSALPAIEDAIHHCIETHVSRDCDYGECRTRRQIEAHKGWPDEVYALRATAKRIRAALAAEAKISRLEAEVEAGWQPIETAPRDGTSILVAILFEGAYFQAVVFWDGAWVDESQGTSYPEPTHWRPQPAPPRTEGERA